MTSPADLTYTPLASTATLRRAVTDPDPQRLFDAALEPWGALRGVIEPLGARLWLTGRSAQATLPNPSLAVAEPMWHLAVDHPPDGVRPQPPTGRRFAFDTAPELSADHLRRWFDRAIGQSALSGDAVVTLETLVLQDERARLFSRAEDTCRLWMDDVLVTRPVSHDADGDWVAFPLPGVDVEPPVRIRVTNEGDALVTDIWVSWSPWSSPGTPEAVALRRALSRLEAEGWQLGSAKGALANR